ncbi:unnamed protein product [Xylocopa violacea]|uniref:Bee-milk protein n=1 Tax=Xylocopa violacea TaxID=135666 RepID=A0ABP1N4W1_XYLVO
MIVHTRTAVSFSLYITILLFFAFVCIPRIVICWQFAAAKLPEDVFIWKFAVWRNRAFLAIPSWRKNDTSEKKVTLFEAIWPESRFSLVKPSKIHSSTLLGKRRNDKNCLRSVVELDVDIRGRLWLLEVPDDPTCFARIVIYNLKRNNQLISSTDLVNVPIKNLRALVVDYSGDKAYIGDPGDESIIAFVPGKARWWKIKMIHGPEVPRVFSTDLAISGKNSMLYMTGSNTLDLFSINLEEVWNDQNTLLCKDKQRNVTVVWRGTKMGTSSGLFCDVKGGLHYFMSSERASVRWDTKLPLKAESHAVLVQNQNYPCISDYAMDGQKNLWALINSRCPFTTDFHMIHPFNVSLKSRTTRIGRFSVS